mgnify:CR=1 FL=1
MKHLDIRPPEALIADEKLRALFAALAQAELDRLVQPTFMLSPDGTQLLGVYDYLRIVGAGVGKGQVESGIEVSTYTGNAIVNGNFAIAQAGTSAALTGTIAYGPDRWWGRHAGSAATLSRVAGPSTGKRYAAKLQRNAGSASTNDIQGGTSLETGDCIPFAGKVIALTFDAKAGANYSGGALTSIIDTGTGTDESAQNHATAGWTGQVQNTQSNAISATDSTYLHLLTVPAGATQIGVRFKYSPTGTAGADDSVTISNVDLRVGSVASPFVHPDQAVELARCRRWFRQWNVPAGNTVICNGQAAAVNVFASVGIGDNVSDMRAVPAINLGAFGNYAVTNAAFGAVAVTAWGVAGAVNTNGTIIATGTVAAGLVAGDACSLMSAAGNAATITADARL